MRIVSLLPSATEIICELGIGDQLVGVSHECDFPDFVCKLPKVTCSRIPERLSSDQIDQTVRECLDTDKSLFSLQLDVLRQINPDLIITQSLCDVCAVAQSDVARAVAQLPSHPQVLDLSPATLDEVFDSILQVGEVCKVQSQAHTSVHRLKHRVEGVKDAFEKSKLLRRKTVILEWLNPLFSAGHWNPQLVELAGGTECIGRKSQKSTTISQDQLSAANPEVLIIACCGFNIERTVQDLSPLLLKDSFMKLQAVQNKRLYVADGNGYFNRPGPRLVDTLELIAHCLYPEHQPLPDHLRSAVIRLDPNGLALQETSS